MRGTVSRADLRRVLAATYHQVWWPDTSVVRFDGGQLPVWDEPVGHLPRPGHRGSPPSWDDALDAIGKDEPLHVARFGDRFDAQGVLAGSKDAARCIGYLTKYLTKQVADCHQAASDAQQAHIDRLAEALRYRAVLAAVRELAPLRHPAEERPARPAPGACKGKAHRREHLGYAGRRVLVSRKWSGKTLADHRADRRTGSRRPSALPPPTRPATPGNPSHPATPTTWNTPGGSCTSSPTASNGTPPSPKPDAERPRTAPISGNEEGGMTSGAGNANGAAADRGRGRRAHEHVRALRRRLIAERRIEFVGSAVTCGSANPPCAEFIEPARRAADHCRQRTRMRGVA